MTCPHRGTTNTGPTGQPGFDVYCIGCGTLLYNVLDTMTDDQRRQVAENQRLYEADMARILAAYP